MINDIDDLIIQSCLSSMFKCTFEITGSWPSGEMARGSNPQPVFDDYLADACRNKARHGVMS